MASWIKNSLSAKVLISITIVSLICAILIITLQVVRDYSREIANVKSELETVAKSYAPGIANALWNVDNEQAEATLSGLLKLPSIAYIEIVLPKGDTKPYGAKPSHFFVYEKPLEIQSETVGTLKIYTNEEEIIASIKDRAFFLGLTQFFATLFVALMIGLIISRLIIGHLSAIKNYLLKMDLSKKNPSPLALDRIKYFKDSNDEFSILVSSINKMEEELYKYTHDLEELVKSRTAQLNEKNRNISKILANIKQGILTIDKNMTVGRDYSIYLEEIFSRKDIAGTAIMHLIFENAAISDNDKSQISSTLTASFVDNSLSFELNKHLLPTELHRSRHGQSQILEMEWDALLGDGDEVEKIMVVIRDVTQLRELALRNQEQEKDLKMIHQILKIGKNTFDRFKKGSLDFLRESSYLLHKKDLSIKVMESIFRNLHTLKGNARSFGLSYAVEVIHKAEQFYSDYLAKKSNVTIDIPFLERDLKIIEEKIFSYDKVVKDMNSDTFEDQDGQKIANLINTIDRRSDEVRKNPDLSALKNFYDIVTKGRAELNFKKLSLMLEKLIKSVGNDAQLLEKATPNFHISEANFQFKLEYELVIQDIFIHFLSNSVDHGLETIEERKKRGKDITGNIFIQIDEGSGGHVQIKIWDDGRGLNIRKLHELGMSRGLLTQDSTTSEIAQIVFQPTVSTKTEVSDISGRGIGLDAVKMFLDKLGGSVHLEIDTPAVDPTRVGFKMLMLLPQKCYMS